MNLECLSETINVLQKPLFYEDQGTIRWETVTELSRVTNRVGKILFLFVQFVEVKYSRIYGRYEFRILNLVKEIKLIYWNVFWKYAFYIRDGDISWVIYFIYYICRLKTCA